MRSQTTTNIATYGLLAAATATSIFLPASLSPRSGVAAPPKMNGDVVFDLNTLVRDFQKGHPDFGAGISGGNGHYAGNVNPTLGASGVPEFVGVVTSPVTNFNITNGATVPNVVYTPMITVLGSAVQYGSYNCPVTVNLHIGSTTLTPFGAFDKPVAGNVNTPTGNPRSYIHPTTVDKNTGVWVEGRVWIKTSSTNSGALDSHWKIYSTFGSSPTTAQVKVLRNGDSVPNVDGFKDQASVKSYLSKYIDASKKKATLQANQTIYLFEFGSTSGTAADFQDLVVLVTLGETTQYLNTLAADGTPPATTTTPKGYKVQSEWRDSMGRNIPPHLMGTATGDVAGSKGSASTGGINSSQSLSHWYTDVMGTNLSTQVPLQLKKDSGGVWEYSTSSFHPVDDALFGNEGKGHNYYFTMNFGVDFTHRAGEHRFVEFAGDDDVWVFIDGKLAMDLGGTASGVKQYLDVDRLGLSNGQKYNLQFFYAQRQENSANFHLRTNLDLGEGTQQTYTVTASGD